MSETTQRLCGRSAAEGSAHTGCVRIPSDPRTDPLSQFNERQICCQEPRRSGSISRRPISRRHLLNITEALLALETDDAYEVFGGDDVKLRSCLTLFAKIAGAESVFSRAPDKVFGGKPDFRTMEILKDES